VSAFGLLRSNATLESGGFEPRRSFRLQCGRVGINISRLSCRKIGKKQKFTRVRGSAGEFVMAMTMPSATSGTFWRGEAGYEEARRGHMWNNRVPKRYPDVVVQARNEQDVVSAVRLARQRGLKVAVRSGGHSWAATFLSVMAAC
jgi:FAD binding domain-containing protein